MLKSNSKQATERIRDYVCDHVNFDYDTVNEKYYYVIDLEKRHENGENMDMFSVYANAIFTIMFEEVIENDKRRLSFQEYFEHWCEGLPSCFDTGYYVNRSAVDILEQTALQRSKYTESQAEEMLTRLIFREIYKVASKR
jgi:hypothetical protein